MDILFDNTMRSSEIMLLADSLFLPKVNRWAVTAVYINVFSSSVVPSNRIEQLQIGYKEKMNICTLNGYQYINFVGTKY